MLAPYHRVDRPRHLPLPRRERTTRLYAGLGCHLDSDGAAFARMGAQRGARFGDRRLQRLGPGGAPAAAARRRLRHLGRASSPGVGRGDAYKYHIVSALRRLRGRQGRPFRVLRRSCRRHRRRARGRSTTPGATTRGWQSAPPRNALDAPMSIYEVHLGSWRRGEDGRLLDLSRASRRSSPTTSASMGFTHVELMPMTEHPFYGSWGYQTTGYFAPTAATARRRTSCTSSTYLHQHGIGVILDWVPSHFPSDEHGLAFFDGTHLYEHADPQQGFHPDWNSCDLQLRPQRGARVPAVERAVLARPLPHRRPARRRGRLDAVSRLRAARPGEWIPNVYGGRENLEAIAFPARAERGGLSRPPRRADDRRGVDRVADGVAPGLRRRARASA